MRYALAAALLAAALTPATARTIYPDMMSAYDLAWDECRARSDGDPIQNKGCQKLKQLSSKLQAAGYFLVPEAANPHGFTWR